MSVSCEFVLYSMKSLDFFSVLMAFKSVILFSLMDCRLLWVVLDSSRNSLKNTG